MFCQLELYGNGDRSLARGATLGRILTTVCLRPWGMATLPVASAGPCQ